MFSFCGAEIEYRIPVTEEDIEELEEMENDTNKNGDSE